MAPCGAASRLIHFKRRNGGRVVIVATPNRCGNSSGLASCVSVMHKRQNSPPPCWSRHPQQLPPGTAPNATAPNRNRPWFAIQKGPNFVGPLLWDGLQAPGWTCLSAKRELVLRFPTQWGDTFTLGLSSKRGQLRFGAKTSVVLNSVQCSAVQCNAMACLARGYFSRCLLINSRALAYLIKLLKHPTAM